VRGSPIRTPSDQRSVGSSPRLIAASHVLHRLLMPRHPPYALNNLTNTQTNSTLDKKPAHSLSEKRNRAGKRCSRPLCSSQPTNSHHPDRPHPTRTPPQEVGGLEPGMALRQRKPPDTPPGGAPGPAPSGPNSVPTDPVPPPTLRSTHPHKESAVLAGRPRPDIRTGQRSTLEHHPDNPPPPTDWARISCWHGSAPPACGWR
jgi:hypothetical protein